MQIDIHLVKIFLKEVWQNARLGYDSSVTDLSNKKDNDGAFLLLTAQKLVRGPSNMKTQFRV